MEPVSAGSFIKHSCKQYTKTNNSLVMITLTELKQYLNITDSSKDTFLQSCIDSSVCEIEDFCNRKLSPDTYVEYLDGNNKTEIYLRNKPINSISSIECFDEYDTFVDLFTGSDTASNSVQIITQHNLIKLLKGYFFYKGCKNIKITYTAGYSTTPDDIKSVLLELATIKFYNSPLSGHARLGKASDNINSVTGEAVTYKAPDWKTVLNKYRLQNV